MEETDLKEESRALSIHSAGGGRRPVKVWNASRSIRKALVVSTYEEFIRKGRHKLGFGILEPLRIVLESDGTQVDDGEYFQTLRENSVFLFLRPGESWIPGGGPDALRSAMIEAIPPIVTETLSSLGLLDQIPSWKIMDNKGRVTVVLHWERGPEGASPHTGAGSEVGPRLPPRKSSSLSTLSHHHHSRPGSGSRSLSTRSTPCLSRDNSRNSSSTLLFGGSLDKAEEGKAGPPPSSWRKGIISGPPPRVLSRQGSSVESGGVLHFHTPQCCAPGRFIHDNNNTPPIIKRDSPPQGSSVECDFHCCSLHVVSSGGEIKMRGGLPPSGGGGGLLPGAPGGQQQPLLPQTAAATTSANTSAPPHTSSELKRSTAKGAHVRFCNIDGEGILPEMGGGSHHPPPPTTLQPPSSSSANIPPTGNPYKSRDHQTSSEVSSKVPLHNGSQRPLPPAPPSLSSSSSSSSSGGSSSDSDCEPATKSCARPRFLLLVDSPPHSSTSSSSNNEHQSQPPESGTHLSIKDIGIILERLSSRIGDVERLEKEAMGGLLVHWTIKAFLKGSEGLRELGILYNNAYYSISEHPGYQSERGGNYLVEEISEEDDDEDEALPDAGTAFFDKKKND